jgi:ATP-dependent DNA helicase RecG
MERALREERASVGRALGKVVEDQWYERKSFRIAPRELANFLIGFANADGGSLVVGLNGSEVEGTDSNPAHRNALVQAAVDFSQPPVRFVTRLVPCVNSAGLDDHLLLLEIAPGDAVYANVKDEVFLRIGDENRRLTFAQRQELLFDRGHGNYESRRLEGVLPTEMDSALVQAYAQALQHPDPERLLAARGLIVGGAMTVGGILLFGRHPQQFLAEGFIRVLRYRGRERGAGARQQVLADERIEGPIPHQLSLAQKIVREQQPTRRALSGRGRFELMPLVPEDAWLEGIVNAAVHRSYSLAGDHVRVEIFDDRIEIESPGRFPGLVDPSDPLNAPRFARNPRIARVCADQHFGQELGEGIRRMFEEMRLAGLADPLYEQTQASVRLTLSAEPVDRALEARLPRETRAIVAALRASGGLSTGEVAETLGISRVTAAKKLQTLRESGLVVWEGKSANDPRATWTLPPT